MTPEERRAFLLDTPRTAKIASVREDGRPHVAPIWFTLDGDVLVFTTWHTTIKANNIRRDGRVSICVDDDRPPFAYVLIDGIAEIVDPTPEAFLRWATEIAGRYMGQDKAEAFGKRNAVPGELLVRVTPTKINAQKGIAD
jgi:PPOX class probable F420-dependent enzyme